MTGIQSSEEPLSCYKCWRDGVLAQESILSYPNAGNWVVLLLCTYLLLVERLNNGRNFQAHEECAQGSGCGCSGERQASEKVRAERILELVT